MRNDLTTRIEYVEKDVDDLTKSVNQRFQTLAMANSEVNIAPITPYNEEDGDKKKRVQSAFKRSNVPNTKLEEMKRWLEYQRKFTAEEIKKKTDQFKEMQDNIYPKFDFHEKENAKSEMRRKNKYNKITHPYQSTVDDLMRSRFESRFDDSVMLPPVRTSKNKISPGKLTVIEFDDLDKVSVHKRR